MEENKPYAIAMWDFSWLERRYPGGGFENWDIALDGLVKRGYNAVRIDAYPHLIWRNPTEEYILCPCWTEHDWGNPQKCRIQVQPNLNNFIRKCKERNVKVVLSNWCRENEADTTLSITSPEVLVEMWDHTIKSIDRDLMDVILYIDMLNEPPIRNYSRFLDDSKDLSRSGAYFNNWMRQAVEGLRVLYPEYPITISSAMLDDWFEEDTSFMDCLDLHIWMSSGLFYEIVDYKYENYDPIGYEKVKRRAEVLYRVNEEYWQKNLKQKIDAAVLYSTIHKQPLITTEGWGVTNYKDMEGLNWEWVKELCEIGVEHAAASKRYVAIATSNFCSPQFIGMWDDISWHQRLTTAIRQADVDEELYGFYRGGSPHE